MLCLGCQGKGNLNLVTVFHVFIQFPAFDGEFDCSENLGKEKNSKGIQSELFFSFLISEVRNLSAELKKSVILNCSYSYPYGNRKVAGFKFRIISFGIIILLSVNRMKC